MQIIFTKEILTALAANGRATREAQDRDEREPDHQPVIKVFNPYGAATWLLTETDPDDPDILFGLCDLGMGEPELGSVRRSELEATRIKVGRFGMPLERDLHFKADRTLGEYAREAWEHGRIVA